MWSGAIEFAHEEIKKIVAAIEDLVGRAGKPKRTVPELENDTEYAGQLKAKVGDRLKDALDTKKHPKFDSYAKVKEIKDELKKELPADDPSAGKKLSKYFRVMLRESIFREQVSAGADSPRPPCLRRDPRHLRLRPAFCPGCTDRRLFTRGETQALVSATLGTTDDAQRMESYEGEQKRKFMLHYNFPPFSVG